MTWKTSAEVARYEEALAWFEKRVPGIDTGAAEDRARGTAFRVAGMLQLDAVQTVFDELQSAINKGTPIADFRKRVREKLGALAPNGFHLETVFRNWSQKSYNRGRVTQMREPSTAKFRPYWMFDAVLDSRVTELCKTCHGVIKLHDDPWWNNRIAPLHHRCRSSIRNLRASEAVKRGITENDPAANAQPKGTFGKLDDDSAEYPDIGKIDPAVLAVLRRKQAELAEELRQADEAARIRNVGGLIVDDAKIQAEMAAAKDLAVKVLDSGAPVGGSERERHDRAMDIVHSELGTLSANHHWSGFETGTLCWYDSSTGPKNTIGHWVTREPRKGEEDAVKQQTGYKGDSSDLVRMARNQYAATQAMLAKRIARGELPMVDKDGFVLLYRGIRDKQADEIRADVQKPANEPLKVLVRSVSSWSTSDQVAKDFAGAGGVVVYQKVHVSRVFSQWEHGKAATLKYHDELEWILVYPEEAVVIPKGDVILL